MCVTKGMNGSIHSPIGFKTEGKSCGGGEIMMKIYCCHMYLQPSLRLTPNRYHAGALVMSNLMKPSQPSWHYGILRC